MVDKNGTLGNVWKSTAWSFWRLYWGLGVTILPAVIASHVSGFVIGLIIANSGIGLGRLSTSLAHGANGMATAVFSPIMLTFLSLAYKHFMYGQGRSSGGGTNTA